MRTDRIIQLGSLVGAVALAAAAGSLLPGIIDAAGQPYVLVEVEDGEGGRRQTRVEVNDLRELRTVTPAARAGSSVELVFDAGGRNWAGSVGDSVRLEAVVDGERKVVDGVFRGTGGHGLRYTDVAVDGAPPIVALGTALGALRGLIVDYLWIKVNMMKEKGLFFEVMSDADLITKLQPRFGQVWAFHGHNMAYNISVLTNTPEERWAWVRAGIDLVRDRGLRYNPNDVILHKELAFWFAHKIDGVSDDAHLYYKREFAREWQLLLGEPPVGHDERIAWIGRIAEAPETLEELFQRNPQTKTLVDRLTSDLSGFERRFAFRLDAEFLRSYGQWAAVRSSNYARLMGLEEQLLRTDGEQGSSVRNRLFQAFERSFNDPELAAASEDFIAFLRRKVLRDSYNMDARLMHQFTRDTGPLDWRHPQAHALYWARRGSLFAAQRYVGEEDVSKIVNNDRIMIQAMQALARSGLVFFDPFSGDNPTRLSDPRWIKVIDRYFTRLYDRYYAGTAAGKGGTADSFTNFHENFMKQAVRELYRAGDLVGAQEILDRLDRLYGQGGVVPNAQYMKPLDLFVREVTYGEYEMQPEVARSDLYAALQRGYREGLLLGRVEILNEAREFAAQLTKYFKENKYNDFVNKFGEGRMKDLIGDLESSERDVLRLILLDTSQPLLDRLLIFRRADVREQRMVFDEVRPQLQAEFERSPLGRTLSAAEVFAEPPGMAEFREARAREAEARARERQNRAEVERR